jgi:hypothetical protein
VCCGLLRVADTEDAAGFLWAVTAICH